MDPVSTTIQSPQLPGSNSQQPVLPPVPAPTPLANQQRTSSRTNIGELAVRAVNLAVGYEYQSAADQPWISTGGTASNSSFIPPTETNVFRGRGQFNRVFDPTSIASDSAIARIVSELGLVPNGAPSGAGPQLYTRPGTNGTTRAYSAREHLLIELLGLEEVRDQPGVFRRRGFTCSYSLIRNPQGEVAMFVTAGWHNGRDNSGRNTRTYIPAQTYHHGIWDLTRNTLPEARTTVMPRSAPASPPTVRPNPVSPTVSPSASFISLRQAVVTELPTSPWSNAVSGFLITPGQIATSTPGQTLPNSFSPTTAAMCSATNIPQTVSGNNFLATFPVRLHSVSSNGGATRNFLSFAYRRDSSDPVTGLLMLDPARTPEGIRLFYQSLLTPDGLASIGQWTTGLPSFIPLQRNVFLTALGLSEEHRVSPLPPIEFQYSYGVMANGQIRVNQYRRYPEHANSQQYTNECTTVIWDPAQWIEAQREGRSYTARRDEAARTMSPRQL